MDIIDDLHEFGLSRQEATLYLALLAEGDLGGYELAKSTGISRSNVYTAVASLLEKGAICLAGSDPARYRALPAAELLDNRLRQLAATRARVLAALPAPRPAGHAYLSIQGARAIRDKLFALLGSARERTYLAMPGAVLAGITEALADYAARGLPLTAISDAEGCALLSKLCPQAVLHRAVLPAGQVRLIIDSHEVITGEIGPGEAGCCLLSSHPNLVDLCKNALRNEIRLGGGTVGNEPQEEPS